MGPRLLSLTLCSNDLNRSRSPKYISDHRIAIQQIILNIIKCNCGRKAILGRVEEIYYPEN